MRLQHTEMVNSEASEDAPVEAAPEKKYEPVRIQLPSDPNLLYNGIRLPSVWPPKVWGPLLRSLEPEPLSPSVGAGRAGLAWDGFGFC